MRPVRLLWSGGGVLVVRGSLLTSGQLATYDAFKRFAKKRHRQQQQQQQGSGIGGGGDWLAIEEGPLLHVVASVAAAAVASTLALPCDVLLARLQVEEAAATSAAGATTGATSTSTSTSTGRGAPMVMPTTTTTTATHAATHAATATATATVARSRPPMTPVQLAARVLRAEGPRAFFRGWWPMFARLAPLYVAGSTSFEQMRLLCGSSYY